MTAMQRVRIGSARTGEDVAETLCNGEARESAASRHALAAANDDVVVDNLVRGKPTQYPRRPASFTGSCGSVEPARITINLREYRNVRNRTQ